MNESATPPSVTITPEIHVKRVAKAGNRATITVWASRGSVLMLGRSDGHGNETLDSTCTTRKLPGTRPRQTAKALPQDHFEITCPNAPDADKVDVNASLVSGAVGKAPQAIGTSVPARVDTPSIGSPSSR